MAKTFREHNCSNCEHCVTGAMRRFRCTALPANPAQYWDGYPEDHWCGIHWTAKKEVKGPIKATQEK